MNKSELVEVLSQELEISVKEAFSTMNIILDSMTEALSKGENIEIRGFGSFTVKNYDSYIGRNPKTGEKITVKAKKATVFKVGKELKHAVDGGGK
jgi:integration host factor subunit beta